MYLFLLNEELKELSGENWKYLGFCTGYKEEASIYGLIIFVSPSGAPILVKYLISIYIYDTMLRISQILLADTRGGLVTSQNAKMVGWLGSQGLEDNFRRVSCA